MFNGASGTTLTNCKFIRNSASNYGAGMYNSTNSNPTLINCTFSGNSTYRGGAIGNYKCVLMLTNCVLWGDTPDEIYDSAGSIFIITYSNVQGGWSGKGNIDADPRFVDPHNDDYHLLEDSPCIDAGTDVGVYADIDGNLRPFNILGIDNNGEFGEFDMGAYEVIVPLIELPMKLTPQVLNLHSHGNFIKAHLVLPEGFELKDVDADTPAALEPLAIESDYINHFINEEGLVEIEIAFNRADFCDAATSDGLIEVTVIGALTTGQYFYGTDTIKLSINNLKHLAIFAFHWLQTNCAPPDWCGGQDLDQDSLVNFVDFAVLDDCCIEVIKK